MPEPSYREVFGGVWLLSGSLRIISNSQLVPRRGLEPPRLAAHGPEPCASTNSATWARRGALEGGRVAVNAVLRRLAPAHEFSVAVQRTGVDGAVFRRRWRAVPPSAGRPGRGCRTRPPAVAGHARARGGSGAMAPGGGRSRGRGSALRRFVPRACGSGAVRHLRDCAGPASPVRRTRRETAGSRRGAAFT